MCYDVVIINKKILKKIIALLHGGVVMAVENNNIVVTNWPFEMHFTPGKNGRLAIVSRFRHDKSQGTCFIPKSVFTKMVNEAYKKFRAPALPAETKEITERQLTLALA